MKQKGFAAPILLVIFLVAVVVGIFIFSRIRGGGSVTEVAKTAGNLISSGGGFDFPADVAGKENLATLRQGCPFKDCIASIDNPVFESVSDAGSWLADEDIVFTVDYKGVARAYPQRIMDWHEIVNDELAGDPILISFCPLCGSSLAFERKVDGQTLEFGVSGKLKDNDLVMYDRQTESLWQQITGEGIVGDFFGVNLKQVPMSGMRWSQFKADFPKGEVLSRDTGFSRGSNYTRSPYGDYEQNNTTLFPVDGGVDNTIHPKTVVYGVQVNKTFKAYELEKIEAEGEITDTVGGEEIKVQFNNGDVKVISSGSGEEIVPTRLFWFAWKAFRPETTLY